ncbi:MAG: NADH:flavin oxidoreductase [Ignavibacteriales bacterium]|nr:NADH:flavin oxidoreductase [Ignavibacteriales bacterium]
MVTPLPEKYFTYKSLDDVRNDVKRLGVDITFEEKLEKVAQPVTIGSKIIGNAFGIHPMEGCDATLDGKPDELTYRRWERFGEGGAKLIWGEATAVVPEGLANPRQLLINEENLPDLESLLNRTRAAHRTAFGRDDDLLVGLQLTHSGRYSYRKPLIAYHHPQADQATFLDKKKGIRLPADYPVVTDDYLERLEDIFVLAVKRAREVGFDFIDIKQCHTYLLNELLGARTRAGKYGGSFENRTRFIRNVLGKIKSELGERIIVASRFNAYDGVPYEKDLTTGVGKSIPYPKPYPYSFGIDQNDPMKEDLTEPLHLVKLMSDLGVKMVNVSMGSPYYNMHLGRPFEQAPIDGYIPPEHPLIGIDRHFRITAAVQKAFPKMVVVGTGYSWLRQFLINAGESNLRRGRVSIVATGRGAIAYPDYAKDALASGKLKSSNVCIAVSHCTNLMRSKNNELGQFPTGCVPRDPIYAQVLKEAQGKKLKNSETITEEKK